MFDAMNTGHAAWTWPIWCSSLRPAAAPRSRPTFAVLQPRLPIASKIHIRNRETPHAVHLLKDGFLTYCQLIKLKVMFAATSVGSAPAFARAMV
jgi:hypothetical protein